MPIPRDCLVCGAQTPGGPYCPAHATQVEARRHDPFYDTPEWRRLRRRVIAKHRKQQGFLCPGWNRTPHLVNRLTADHIVARANGGAALDEANLQVLCLSCNDAKGWGHPLYPK